MASTAEWIGRVGQSWAGQWTRTDRAFAPLTARLLSALDEVAPRTGRAVDVGCGAGETSLALAALRPQLEIVGVDVSAELVDAARSRSAERPNLSFVQADAVDAAASLAPVDLFLSRHGIMFFDDPVAAFGAFRTAAAPGARLVFTCFRDWSLNCFASDFAEVTGEGAPPPLQPGPFAFADERDVRRILASSGWADAAAEAVDYGFRVGEGDDPIEDAVSFMTRIGPAARALRDAPESERPRLKEMVARRCAARLEGDKVDFPAAAWLWTAAAAPETTL